MPTAANPILVTLERGGHAESWHRGAAVVVGPDGVLAAVGDVDAPVFWRSAAKPFQAAAAVVAGTHDAFDLEPAHLALACASHGAEPEHLRRAAELLARGGFGPGDLRCGTHAPLCRDVAADLARRGERPTPLHHNCSGKHAMMLLFARMLDADPSRYLDPASPVQERVRDAVLRLSGCPAESLATATDGCSAPTFRAPLMHLARAFRHLGRPDLAAGLDAPDRAALLCLRDAMVAHPHLVAGSGRIDTDLIRAGNGRFVSKVGAEGVIACAVPERGLGIAVKMDGGQERGAHPVLLALLERASLLAPSDRDALARHLDPVLRNHAGTDVGRMRVRLEP